MKRGDMDVPPKDSGLESGDIIGQISVFLCVTSASSASLRLPVFADKFTAEAQRAQRLRRGDSQFFNSGISSFPNPSRGERP
jgi:hypothetical protein